MAAQKRRLLPVISEHLESRRLLSGTVLQTLASLGGTTGVASQNGGLIVDAKGNLFGVTQRGGVHGAGTIFVLPKGSTKPTILAAFNGNNGAGPVGGLLMDASGNLFGTTVFSGLTGTGNFTATKTRRGLGFGTVFELAKGAANITTLATFSGADGQSPTGTLVMDASGNLFGTTLQGGPNGDGTVFEVASGSNAITTLAAFNGTNGSHPVTGLLIDSTGNLFGTTQQGGASNAGTVFEIAQGSGAITDIASFNRVNGAKPASPLLMDASGNLFGATSAGGAHGEGTVFEIAAGSGVITTLASFNGLNGATPQGALALDSSGDLFGTTRIRGGAGSGTVFEIVNGSGAITTLGVFNGTKGALPQGVVMDASGTLYGATQAGGEFGLGTIFRVITTDNTPGAVSAIVSRESLPQAIVAGSVLESAATVTLNDSISASGPVNVQVFATTNGALDPSAVQIGVANPLVNIKAGSPVALDVRIISLPASLPGGTYSLIAQVVDPLGNVGVSPPGPAIQVEQPMVALSPTFTRVTLPATVLSGARTPAVASLTITNIGNIPSFGAFTVAIYASPDGQLADGVLITSTGRSLTLPPNASVALNVPLGMIPSSLQGSYSLVAAVTDPNGNVLSNPSAGVFTASPAAVTLSASVDAFQPAAIVPQTSIRGSVAIAVTNAGNIAVGSPLAVNLKLVSSDELTTIPLQTFTSPVLLNPGQARTLTFKFDLGGLSPTLAGTYFPMVSITAPGGFSAEATGASAVTVG